MPTGLIKALILGMVFYILAGQRVLDKLKLTDRAALIIISIMAIITVLAPNITLSSNIEISVGGGIIPIVIVLHLFIRDTDKLEKYRALLVTPLSAIAIYFIDKSLPHEPENILIDINFVYGVTCGTIAYLVGHSSRNAFIAGVMGVLLNDVASLISNINTRNPVPVKFGGAGLFDSTVIAGLISVILVETLNKIGKLLRKIF